MTNLLPCPFCGTKPVTERTGFSGRALYIYCINDNGCPRPKAIGETAEKAAENWNTRAGAENAPPSAQGTECRPNSGFDSRDGCPTILKAAEQHD